MKLAWCAIALAFASADAQEKETWRLTLREAIQIGLDNSEIVRVIAQGKQATPVGNCFGPPTAAIPPPSPSSIDLPKGMHSDRSSLLIGRLNADVSIPRFKSAVMASIRSINRQYLSLAEARAALWAAEQTVNLGQEVVRFEETDMMNYHGGIQSVAEATQRLEAFQKVLARRKTEVDKSERQLRQLLGLPQFDNRQIIPVDHPIKEHVIFDRAECLEVMMQKQPDIIQQKALRHLADQKLTEARNAITAASTNPLAHHDNDVNLASTQPSPRSNHPLTNTRTAQYAVTRSQESLDQVVQQSTQSLDQALREVETEYQSYAKTRRLRNAAEKRLEAQWSYWEEGRITADRYLDAVEQYATLLTSEHQHLSAYNAALAVVSECKGTLLEDQNIVVAEPHRVARASAADAPK
jgi:outer membrane protein TolC